MTAKDEATGTLGKIKGAFGDMTKIAGGFVLGQGILKAPGAIASIISAGSDMNETLSKSQAIFGASSKDIEKWASGAAMDFGQSKEQALAAASTFGNMFDQLGIGAGKAATMSKEMVELASDFASFHNADISDVLAAQTAAFRGEFDAVQKFVPTINAAAVAQKAMEMTGKATTKELTEQDKVLATQALLWSGAGKAMGDFDKTAKQPANAMRTLKAVAGDLKTQIGTALIPIVGKLAQVMVTDVIPMLREMTNKAVDLGRELAERLGPALREMADVIARDIVPPLREDILPALADFARVVGELGGAIASKLQGPIEDFIGFLTGHKEILQGFAVALGVMATAWGVYTAAQIAATAAGWAFTAIPIIALISGIIIALTALAAGIIYVVKNWDEITTKYPAIGAASDTLKEKFQAFVDWITSTFVPAVQVIYDKVSTVVGAIVDFVKEHFPPIWENGIRPTLEAIAIGFQTQWEVVKVIVETVLAFIKGQWDIWAGIFTGDWSRVWGGVKDSFAAIWNGLEDLVGVALDGIKELFEGPFGPIKDAIVGAWEDVVGAIGTAWEGLTSIVQAVVNSIIGQVNTVIGALNSVISAANKVPGVSIPSIPQVPTLGGGGGGFVPGNPWDNPTGRTAAAAVNVTIEGPGMATLASELRVNGERVFA